MYSSYLYTVMPFYIWSMPWMILLLGICALIYGIKQILDDILKIMIASSHRDFSPPVQRPPMQY